MAKYHINDRGEPGICHAKNKCPFGDLTDDHFSSKDEARTAYENRMSSHSADDRANPITLASKINPESSTVNVGDYIWDDFNSDDPMQVVEVRQGWSPDVKVPSWSSKDDARENDTVYVYRSPMGWTGQTMASTSQPASSPRTLAEQMLPARRASEKNVKKGSKLQRRIKGNDYADRYAAEFAEISNIRIRNGQLVGAVIQGEDSSGYYSFSDLGENWNLLNSQDWGEISNMAERDIAISMPRHRRRARTTSLYD